MKTAYYLRFFRELYVVPLFAKDGNSRRRTFSKELSTEMSGEPLFDPQRTQRFRMSAQSIALIFTTLRPHNSLCDLCGEIFT